MERNADGCRRLAKRCNYDASRVPYIMMYSCMSRADANELIIGVAISAATTARDACMGLCNRRKVPRNACLVAIVISGEETYLASYRVWQFATHSISDGNERLYRNDALRIS